MNQPETPKGHLPIGLLGTLVLICLIEWTLNRSSLWLLTPDQAIAKSTIQHLREHSKDRQFLVFGDSQAKQSIAPRELESLTQRSGYNLALAGSQAPNSYFLLRKAIEAGARPELVIVDFFPPLQRLSHWHVVENDPFLLSSSDALDLAIQARDPGFLASLLARKTVPSFRMRHTIRTAALESTKCQPATNWAWAGHILIRNHLANHGAQVHPANPITPERIAQLNADYFPRWEIMKLHEHYIERFLALAESKGVKVAWLLSPFHPDLQRLTESSGFDAAWTAYLQNWQRKHPSLMIIDGRHLNYPATAFLDPNHLAEPGIAAFSQALAPHWPTLTSSSDTTKSLWLSLTPAPAVSPSYISHLEDIPTTARLSHESNRARVARDAGSARTR